MAANQPFITARDESYQLRAKATAAMCRVRLVGGDTALNQLAERALNATTEIHQAAGEEDRAGGATGPASLSRTSCWLLPAMFTSSKTRASIDAW